MNSEYISDALGAISDRHIAAGFRRKGRRRSFFLPLAAAVLVLAVIAGSLALLTREGGAVVSVYAAGSDEELTRAGESFVTGSVSDNGELTGHPLMFYVTGKNIASVRLCAKNEALSFTDLTEKRDEFGTASCFTVPYGENETEYSFLVYDWVPLKLLGMLRRGEYDSVAAVPPQLRRDLIVLTVTFSNGDTAEKAVNVRLLDNGTFYASSGDYEPGEDDGFLSRPDAKAIPRNEMYGAGVVDVRVQCREGEEPRPSGSYDVESVNSILVSWEGREPEMVQMFFSSKDADGGEKMELLRTYSVNSAERSVTFPGRDLEGVDEGEVWFVITVDDEHIVTSGRLSVRSKYAGAVENGELCAYIRGLTDGELTFDRVEWVTVPGQRAHELGITEDDAPSGFVIHNASEREETLRLSDDCGYSVLDWEDSFNVRNVSEHDFMKLLAEREGRDVPYILTVRDGVIVEVDEKYVP